MEQEGGGDQGVCMCERACKCVCVKEGVSYKSKKICVCFDVCTCVCVCGHIAGKECARALDWVGDGCACLHRRASI